MAYINRGIEPTELPRSDVVVRADIRANIISPDQKMVEEAQSQLADNGIRCFWREDAQIRYNYEEIKLYLEVKARNGDIEAKADLEELLKQNDAMQQLKSEFHATKSLSEKKSIQKQYKVEEMKLNALLHKGGE